LFATIRRTGSTADFLPRMLAFDEFNELVGLSSQRRHEAEWQRYADDLVQRHKH
jgi:hypothetical protein